MDRIDSSFVELVVQNGLATREQVDECVEIVEKAIDLGAITSLADTMVGKGYLSRSDADALLIKARRSGAKTSLAGYELLGKLGRGGMGTVYKARQVTMDRIVAVKVLRPSLSRNEVYIERFFREARAAAKLNHSNIIHAIDAGFAEGYHYLVMEFVDGPTLARRLKDGPLSEAETLKITYQVAQALAHAQDHGIVHRDVKPENIMLTSAGVVKLADLGLAKSFEADSSITVDGKALGTPYYMSPEQARGESGLDTRSDIYSLGATLFHLVTGSVPFDGETPAIVVSKRLTEQTPSPRDIRPDISIATNRLIRRMMATDPANRYQTADELLSDIEAAMRGETLRPLQATTGASAIAASRKSKAAAKPNKLGLVVGCAAGVLALAVVVWLATRDWGPEEIPLAQKAEKAFAAAAAYRQQHPDDLAGAIRQFDVIVKDFAGTEAAYRASRQLKQLTKQRDDEITLARFKVLHERCAKLVEEDEYGAAAARVDAFEKKYTSSLATTKAAELKRDIMEKAARRYTEHVKRSDAALDKNDYAAAKAALKPIADFGLRKLREEARKKLAEIERREKEADALARWKKIEAQVAQFLEAGRLDDAESALAQAKSLPGHRFAGLIGERTKAISEARLHARQQQTAKIEAAGKCIAAFDEQVRPLLALRTYQKAKAEFEKIAAREDISPARGQIEVFRKDIARITAFWAEVKKRSAGLKRGQTLTIDGKRLKFARYRDETIRCSLGGATVGFALDKIKPKEVIGILGPKFPETGELALQCAVFLLFDGTPDPVVAKKMLARVDPGPEVDRYIELAGTAFNFEADEAAAEKAFAKLQKAASARPTGVKVALAEFSKNFVHTRFYNEQLFEIERLRSGKIDSDPDDKSGLAALGPGMKRALLGYWPFNRSRNRWVLDISGKNNHAKTYDRVKFTKGIKGGCAELDTGDLEVPCRPRLSPKGSFSVDFFMKPRSLYMYSSGPTLVSMGTDKYGWVEDHASSAFAVRLQSGGVGFDIWPRTSIRYITRGSEGLLKTGKWYHIAAVLDTTQKKAFLYVNAKKVREFSTTAEMDNTTRRFPLRIGGMGYKRYEGCIDELHLWAVPLTQKQVGMLADMGGLGPGSTGSNVEEDRKKTIAEYQARMGKAISLKSVRIPPLYAAVGILNRVEVPFQWGRSARAIRDLSQAKANVDAPNAPAGAALEQMLAPLRLRYEVDDAGVFLKPEDGFTPPGEAEADTRDPGEIKDRLRGPVSLVVPYPEYYKESPVHQIPVQYAVLLLLDQVDVKCDRAGSQHNAGKLWSQWITPQIQELPCDKALEQLLGPLRLTYRIEKGKVVVVRRK